MGRVADRDAIAAKPARIKSDSPHVTKGMNYALDVMSGKITACKWVKAACKRHINDLRKAEKSAYPFYFAPERAEHAARFMERFPHIKGSWAAGKGSLIVLEPWQCFIVMNIFGWLRKKDGQRRFREAYVEVARKNAKSTLAALIGLYMFVADNEPGAEVYSGATTEKQAWEVFKPARLMALQADGFKTHYGVQVNASNLNILNTASKFEPIIGNPGDGASPHCAIIDEFHEHKSPEQYDTMITGMGARLQPLVVVITTAGTDLSCPCYNKRDQILKILDGILENDDVFGIVYCLDEDDDWTDYSLWGKANPNLGVSVFDDYLRARHREAMQNVSRQNIIRCKHLNQWMNADVAFFDMQAWKRCEDKNLKTEDFAGQSCIIALDLASKIDLAAKIKLFRTIGEDGKAKYAVFATHYLPEDIAEYGSTSNYQTWAKEGWITLTPGDVIDFRYIQSDIEDDKELHEIREVAYDPFQATMFAIEMSERGFPMIEYGATVKNFSEPMKELDSVIREGRLRHNGDPVLGWEISNVTAHIDAKDNVFPRKEIPENKIDGAVALIIGMGRAILEEKPVLIEMGFIEV